MKGIDPSTFVAYHFPKEPPSEHEESKDIDIESLLDEFFLVAAFDQEEKVAEQISHAVKVAADTTIKIIKDKRSHEHRNICKDDQGEDG